MRNGETLLADLALGAAAGVAATWAMGRVTTFMYEREDEQARQREDAVRSGTTADEAITEKLVGSLGLPLPEPTRRKLGHGMRWAIGAGAGAVYGVLRRRVPRVDAGQGLAFGAAMFAGLDEGAGTALGVVPPPTAFPWQAHARGLAGHLVYGVVTDTLLDAADRARH